MRLWTLSSDVEICRVRADANEEVVEVGRGDQALECNPAPLLPERLSVWSPMLTYWAAVCVDRLETPTTWGQNEYNRRFWVSGERWFWIWPLKHICNVRLYSEQRVFHDIFITTNKHILPGSQVPCWTSSPEMTSVWPGGRSWSSLSCRHSGWLKSLQSRGHGRPARTSSHRPRR